MKLKLNENGRCHIKVVPLCNTWNGDMADTWTQLSQRDDLRKIFYYRNTKLGLMYTIYEMDGLIYATQCVKNEYKTQNAVLFISDNESDMLACFKMLSKNTETVGKDYRDMVNEYLSKQHA